SQSEGLAQLPASPQPEVEPPATVASVLPQVGNCESCGFPVSLGRRFCVECEKMEADKVVQSVSAADCPDFLSRLTTAPEPGWLHVDPYTVGTALVAVLTIILLVLKYR